MPLSMNFLCYFDCSRCAGESLVYMFVRAVFQERRVVIGKKVVVAWSTVLFLVQVEPCFVFELM